MEAMAGWDNIPPAVRVSSRLGIYHVKAGLTRKVFKVLYPETA